MFLTTSDSKYTDDSPVEWDAISSNLSRHQVFMQSNRKKVYSGNNILNSTTNELKSVGYNESCHDFVHELEDGIFHYWFQYPEDMQYLGDRAKYTRDFVSGFEEYEADSYTCE